MLAAPRRPDPAADAARLLGWVGFALLMVGAPLAGVVSRRALFILLPIGTGLLLSASTVSASGRGRAALRGALRHPIGLAAIFLFAWGGLSLLWTPVPRAAAPLFIGLLVTAALSVLVIAYVPERRPHPVLALLPVGVAVTALATLGLALFGPASFRGGTEFDPSLLERSVLTLAVLVWPALGALVVFGRWRLAAALAVVVAATVSISRAPIAMAVFAIAAVTFAQAMLRPGRVARTAALATVVLVGLAPLLPFALAPLASALSPVGRSTVAAMTDWRAIVVADGARLVTGHGLDTARRGVVVGVLPGHAPRTILFSIWYELGVLGAFALAAVFALGLAAAGRANRAAAPAVLGGMVAVLAITAFGVATEQSWFATLAGLQAVALGLLCRWSRIGVRPQATLSPAALLGERPANGGPASDGVGGDASGIPALSGMRRRLP